MLQRVERGIHGLNRWAVNCREMSGKRGVQTDRSGPSPPSCVAKAEMSTADRLGSREGSSRAGWREPVGCVELAMTHRSASTCWHPGNVVCPQRSPPGRPGWSPTQAPHKSVLAQLTHTAPRFNLRDPLSVVVSWTRPRVPMHPPCFRVGHWRAHFRVRWQFHAFLCGPQSGSHGHVSSRPP